MNSELRGKAAEMRQKEANTKYSHTWLEKNYNPLFSDDIAIMTGFLDDGNISEGQYMTWLNVSREEARKFRDEYSREN